MKPFIVSRKGQIFALFIVVVFIIAGFYIVFLAIKGKMDFSGNMKPPVKTLEMYDDASRFMLFAEEAGKLSLSQVYYEFARDKMFAGNCIISGDYIELCSISPSLDNELSLAVSKLINNYTLSYYDERFHEVKYSADVDGDDMTFTAEPISLHTAAETGFFPFKTVYEFNPSFSINLKEGGMEDMVFVVSSAQDCFEKRKESDIFDCMKKVETFNSAISNRDNKFFFDLSSKSRFFYSQDSRMLYEPIILKFFIEESSS